MRIEKEIPRKGPRQREDETVGVKAPYPYVHTEFMISDDCLTDKLQLLTLRRISLVKTILLEEVES